MAMHIPNIRKVDWRNKLILFIQKLFFCLVLIGCGTGKSNDAALPEVGDKKIIAVVKLPNGNKEIFIVLRRIYKQIKTDSLKKIDVITVDTIWGRPVSVNAIDSLGRILKTKSGKDSISPNPVYIPTGKDSINIHVEGISVDSLLKR